MNILSSLPEDAALPGAMPVYHAPGAFLAIVDWWAVADAGGEVPPHPLLPELAAVCCCGVDLGDHDADEPRGCFASRCGGFHHHGRLVATEGPSAGVLFEEFEEASP